MDGPEPEFETVTSGRKKHRLRIFGNEMLK
jgi:hypothetical protein